MIGGISMSTNLESVALHERGNEIRLSLHGESCEEKRRADGMLICRFKIALTNPNLAPLGGKSFLVSHARIGVMHVSGKKDHNCCR